MLKSFQIKRFRLFEHIEIKRLSRVNLVVGKNNSGKSTFLEAIELYASNASPSVILDLVRTRQENWDSKKNPLRHLFFGRHLCAIDKDGIVVGEISLEESLHISIAAYQTKIDDNGNLIRTQIHSDNFSDDDSSGLEKFLIAEENGRIRRILKSDEDVMISDNTSTRLHIPKQYPASKYISQIVSTDNISNRNLSTLWDSTSLTDLEPDVISALHLIDSRISGIAFVEDASKENERIPLVKIKGVAEPFPLKSMGDGITRLFHIIVALVNARNGLLLIDEFENGLHWTVQPQVWDVVFQLAEKLNVQVFATTHSRDCVRGFDEAWQKYPDLGAFFRLENKNGSVKTAEYTSETLTDAIDMDVEVR
jgi:AAA15 family ATPase/GTPase